MRVALPREGRAGLLRGVPGRGGEGLQLVQLGGQGKGLGLVGLGEGGEQGRLAGREGVVELCGERVGEWCTDIPSSVALTSSKAARMLRSQARVLSSRARLSPATQPSAAPSSAMRASSVATAAPSSSRQAAAASASGTQRCPKCSRDMHITHTGRRHCWSNSDRSALWSGHLTGAGAGVVAGVAGLSARSTTRWLRVAFRLVCAVASVSQ